MKRKKIGPPKWADSLSSLINFVRHTALSASIQDPAADPAAVVLVVVALIVPAVHTVRSTVLSLRHTVRAVHVVWNVDRELPRIFAAANLNVYVAGLPAGHPMLKFSARPVGMIAEIND